jgi:hypothetical protein
VIYNDAVYLVCAGFNGEHGTGTIGGVAQQPTYVSTSPALATWTTKLDGCDDCGNLNVERMAVPFDGIGTLVLIDSNVGRDLYWQSATGAFQKPSGSLGTTDHWTSFQAGGMAFQHPWLLREGAAPPTDAEGLVLVMTSEAILSSIAFFNDVWQLSWQSDVLNPLVYRLTSAAPFGTRFSTPGTPCTTGCCTAEGAMDTTTTPG